MTATIADLVMRLRNQIRDNGTVQVFPDTLDSNNKPIPGSSPELIQFIQDAVMEFSKYRPRKRSLTLKLIPGQITYELPEDWITVDNGSFKKAIQPSPLPDPTAYALPFVYVNHPLGTQLNTMAFNWYDDDKQLILGSSPFQEYTLTFDYYACHTADESSISVPKMYWSKALLLACEKALRAIATDTTVKLQKYKIGGRNGIEIDDSKVVENLLKEADAYRDMFKQEVILKAYATSGDGEDGTW